MEDQEEGPAAQEEAREDPEEASEAPGAEVTEAR